MPPSPKSDAPKKVEDIISRLSVNGVQSFKLMTENPNFIDSSAVKEWIPTGLVGFDRSMGGGFPAGRIVEIFGPEASFKSGLTQQAMEHAILMDGVGVLYDNEQVFDFNKNRLATYVPFLYGQKNVLEEFYVDCMDKMKIISEIPDVVSLVAWDSLPATRPMAAMESKIGAKDFGGAQAAMMHADTLPKILELIRESSCSWVVINQIRDSMDDAMGSDPWSTPGGRALKFYASVRIQIKPKGGKFFWTSSDDRPQGFYVETETKKNKVTPPFQRSSFAIVFEDNRGGDPAINMLEELTALKYTANKSGYFTFEGLPGVRVSKRVFHEVYRDEVEFFLDLYEKLTGFAYSPKARSAVIQYVRNLYAPKLTPEIVTA